MADPGAGRDWYFGPARNDFNFGNKESHGARSGEYGGGGGGQNNYSFFLQKRRNYCGGMSRSIVM